MSQLKSSLASEQAGKESALRDKAGQAGQLTQLQQQVSSLSMQAEADVRRLSLEG
jgi:hypothetical protein